jgi:hypothetical protein
VLTAPLTDPTTTFGELYAEVQQFYAHHMHLLDDGRADEWADRFTPDGTFFAPTMPAPTTGRAQLAAAVRQAHQAHVEIGEQRRHWHGMLSVEPREDGSYLVTCYAQVIHTPRGGTSRIHRACVCRDVLVRAEDGLQIRERVVTRDDLVG